MISLKLIYLIRSYAYFGNYFINIQKINSSIRFFCWRLVIRLMTISQTTVKVLLEYIDNFDEINI